ncbi:hypothetical protein EVAR_36955_1 [Eumeta japonica]|uniref:Uncharacterized protein n=1 Tax=Eumeta variegata TaxID=151549 RepID=A0A4C1W9E4_EUMVA|nr:hypothetical protein EVAR_36955_1 [Eumeta japonica]
MECPQACEWRGHGSDGACGVCGQLRPVLQHEQAVPQHVRAVGPQTADEVRAQTAGGGPERRHAVDAESVAVDGCDRSAGRTSIETGMINTRLLRWALWIVKVNRENTESGEGCMHFKKEMAEKHVERLPEVVGRHRDPMARPARYQDRFALMSSRHMKHEEPILIILLAVTHDSAHVN